MFRLFLVLVLVALPVFVSSCLAEATHDQGPVVGSNVNMPQDLPWVDARLGSHTLRLMIARSESEKRTGLMFRSELARDEGMLFIYDTPHQMTFWMKNTILPLDLVFFSPDLEVTESIIGMKPGIRVPEESLPRYSSSQTAQYALELASGTVTDWGIKAGDLLEVPLPYLHSN